MPTGYPDYLRGFQQPNALYVSATDLLSVAAATSQSTETVFVYYRVWQTDRTIKTGTLQVSPLSTRVVKTANVALPEGFLLSLSVQTVRAVTRGQTFARVYLISNVGGAGQATAVFMADYVTTQSISAYPNGRVLSPSEGPGWVKQVSVANPAANAEFSFTVPTNARWLLVSVRATFTTDANAGIRVPAISLTQPGGASIWLAGFQANPSEIDLIHAAPGVAAATVQEIPAAQFVRYIALPPIVILGAGTITSQTTFVGAADAYTNITCDVEEWLDNV